jgi:carbon storage regulator
MLFLTRKIDQAIRINDEIEIRVIEISGKTVRLGINYPKTAQVYREELYQRIQEQNRAAAAQTLEIREELNELHSEAMRNPDAKAS